jgi:citrate synthase
MLARAEKLGVAGKYIEFTREIVKAAQAVSDAPVDLDMLGATGATMLDLGFTPEATWAILAVTRSFAVGAHYIEEVEREGHRRTGQTLTPKEFYDGPEDRPVPPLKDRSKVATSGICHTVDEWARAREEKKKLVGSGHSIVEEIEDPSKKSGIKKVGKL